MKSVSKLALSLYGLALLASLAGASMLLSAFLIAANWNYGIHALMVAYFLVSSLGTFGLLIATLFFWSNNAVVISVGLISNVETLIFSSLLAAATVLDKHVDPSPMSVGLSRSVSIGISLVTWLAVPISAGLVGTLASLWRSRNSGISEEILMPQGTESNAYPRG